jgi:hypothetical protein
MRARITDVVGRRWQVVTLWLAQKKKSLAKICTTTGRSHRYINKWLKVFDDTGTVDEHPRGYATGAHRIINDDASRCASRMMHAKVSISAKGVVRGKSARETARALHSEGTTPRVMSTQAIRNRVRRDVGITYHTLRAKMYLRPENIPKRLAFAEQNRTRQWRNVMFLDSKYFVMRHSDPKQKRMKVWAMADWSTAIPVCRGSVQVHAYAGISRFGQTDLVFVTGTSKQTSPYKDLTTGKAHKGVCALEFRERVLDAVIVPQAREIFKAARIRKWELLYDNAPPHSGSQEYMACKGVNVVQGFSAQSPDLNPSENEWGWMAHRMEAQDYADLDDFKRVLQETWASVPVEVRQSICGNMPSRLQACIDKGGRMTNY